MIRVVAVLGIAVLFGCTILGESEDPAAYPGWQRIEAGTAFTFHAPAELKGGPEQGIDSFVGTYSMPGMTIGFDYGWYTGCYPTKAGRLSIPGARVASLAVEQRSASGADSLPYRAVLCAALPGKISTRLGMWADCASEEKQAVAVRILRSVRLSQRPHK